MLTNNQINKISELMSKGRCVPIDAVFIEFTNQIKSVGYSISVVKEAKYTIHSLLVFLDINHYSYSTEIADVWLDIQKSMIRKTECKTLKRILFVFNSFLEERRIIPDRRNTLQKFQCNSLPDWCKPELSNFLDLKREKAGANQQ